MTALFPKRRRTAANAWIDSIDPLNGLSIQQARQLYNAARRHGSPLIQKIYSEIEETDPVLMTCVERRSSALAGLGWRAVADASAADSARAEEHRRALEDFANGIGNLYEAVEHLDLAFFRGHSVVQPVWHGGGVDAIALLDSWNFLSGDDGRLLWNPDCSTDPAACEEITPAARAVILRRRRAIDWPALTVYLRGWLGEREWGRFLERYGLPPVDAVMAPSSNKEQRADYVEAVADAHDGRCVAWPSGTTVSRAEGARGQDPFSAFIEHQEKLVVLMATGGTLTSLAQADTGSLAGGAQMDVWEQIVSRDGVVVAAALNRGLFRAFLAQEFPGEKPLAHFELGREKEPTASEAAELAAKLRTAGWRIEQSQLEEATGYTLEREEAAPPPYGFAANKAPAGALPSLGKNKAELPDIGKTENALLRSFAEDFSPAAKKLAALLEKADAGEDIAQEARKLAEELPGLMPEEPAMAEELAAAMAEAFAEELASAEKVENAIANPCPDCHRNMPKDGPCSFCAKRKANHEAGKAAFDEVARTHKDKVGAMERDSIGKIDFIWGDDTEGICHIMGKHKADASMIPGVIAYGDVYEDEANGKYYIVKKKNFVSLRKMNAGNHYLITGFTADSPDYVARIRKEHRLVEKGE